MAGLGGTGGRSPRGLVGTERAAERTSYRSVGSDPGDIADGDGCGGLTGVAGFEEGGVEGASRGG